jgi:hypothetical protein
VKLPVLEVFADGSWRSELGAGHPKGSPRDKLDYGYGYAAAGRTV